MNDVCVVTLCIGDEAQSIGRITQPLMRAYAEKIGADFYVIDKTTGQDIIQFEKFQIFYLLHKYKRIIYIDNDILIRPDCPNLIPIVPADKLGMFNEGRCMDRSPAIAQVCRDYGHDLRILKDWTGQYYNSGVMVISRAHKELFEMPEKQISNFFEQSYLNLRIYMERTPVYELNYKFNCMTCVAPLTGEDRHASYMIHYAGCPGGPKMISELMEQDLKKWEATAPNYQFKRHIYIDVQGGLGDQIDAEPAIRYLLTHIYNQDDVVIGTHWPRIFSHLTDQCRVAKHGELFAAPDAVYHRRCSLPGPETQQWRVVSNLMSHTVDFCSMALLTRTLPDKDKTIRLTLSAKDEQELADILGDVNPADLVAVHPGRHWPSKTFPTEWWQAVIDGMAKEGLKVAIIGRNDETRGTVPVVARDGVLDLRDVMTIGALFSICLKAKVLVSNDSSPVHIAGGGNAHIIMIPTCKHPDHIFPYRNGTKQYKTTAMYKKLTLDALDTAPSQIHMNTADMVIGNILDYIPEAADVVAEAKMRCVEKPKSNCMSFTGHSGAPKGVLGIPGPVAPRGDQGVTGKYGLPTVCYTRPDIPKDRITLLDYLGVEGKKCAEIGVFRGEYAAEIFKRNPDTLFLVDPWKYWDEKEYTNDIANVSQAEFETIYQDVRRKFWDSRGRLMENVAIVRMTSYQAAYCQEVLLDIVFIDANHSYDYCLSDLLLWAQKVNEGGYLVVHDFTGWYDGVRKAVNTFCKISGQQILFATPEDNNGTCVIQIRR